MALTLEIGSPKIRGISANDEAIGVIPSPSEPLPRLALDPDWIVGDFPMRMRAENHTALELSLPEISTTMLQPLGVVEGWLRSEADLRRLVTSIERIADRFEIETAITLTELDEGVTLPLEP